jgi:hypothetical protein
VPRELTAQVVLCAAGQHSIAFVFARGILARPNMKKRFVCAVLLAWAWVPVVSAIPILPFQQSIEQQLTIDIAGGGDTAVFEKALAVYNRPARSLSKDISILRQLNELLAAQPGYAVLLADAANAYLVDFQARRDAVEEQLRPAPRSATKLLARSQLRRLDTSLSRAVNAAGTGQQISALQSAATRLNNASNTVQRALRARIGLSSMAARIGVRSFESTRGFIIGGTNFTSTPGIGAGMFNDGVLAVTAIANGNIVRALHLHVEGITSDTPATYPLGTRDNFAFYNATDRRRRREYHFQADPALTNSIVPNAFVTIEYIGTNYILGRFSFMGTNSIPAKPDDTNTVVTVSDGEFQLNFNL